MSKCIKANGLSVQIGKKQILDGVSFEVEKGQCFGLLGPNGAGKSTTLDCLIGYRKPQGGTVSLLGQKPDRKKRKLFEQVGVQLQATSYENNIRVLEVCQEIACLYETPADYVELLKEFDLEDKQMQMVDKLSGGEKQRLSLVVALISNPKVLFLDELTTGLDVEARRQVWSVLKTKLEQGMTIFLTSHYMDEVEALCQQIAIIKEGKIVTSGNVKDLVKDSPCDSLEDAYLWYLKEEV